jgi:hypothetical protein
LPSERVEWMGDGGPSQTPVGDLWN